MEEWREVEIPGARTKYEVSDEGRVRRLLVTGLWKNMRHKLDTGGRPCIRVSKKMVRLHVLVCAAFKGPRPSGMFVLHYDGNPTNNHLSNLRYGTHSENTQDAIRHGTHRCGEASHLAKHTKQQVDYIRQLRHSGKLLKEIASMTGVPLSSVGHICAETRWRH